MFWGYFFGNTKGIALLFQEQKMIRQRLIQAAVICLMFGLLTAMCRLMEGDGITAADVISYEQKTSYEGQSSGGEELYGEGEPPREELADLSEAFFVILNETSRDFYRGYAIDESFLLWLEKTYGEDCVERIAARVKAGEQDFDIWYQETGCSIHVLWLGYCQRLNYSSYLLENVSWMDTASDGRIVMDFVGDINLDDSWYTMQALSQRDGDFDACISPEIQEELQSADLTMLNNEFTYSERGRALEGKAYTFRARPENVRYLEQLGVDLVSLANNHVCDYGDDALIDTMQTLNDAGIQYVGAGHDIDEATEIRYYVAAGRKIAIVSATQIEKSYTFTKQATENTPGVLKTLNEEKFVEVIRRAEQTSDYVIAYVHWGTEGILKLQNDQRKLAKAYIAAGADLIIGNHSHRLQGMEYIDGVPVINSLGNFWFSNGNLYATILQVVIDEEGSLNIAFIPCVQEDLTTSLIQDETEREYFFKYIADLSEGIGMDEEGNVYAMDDERYTREELDGLRFHSQKGYGFREGGYDILGRRIDIVGNY